MVKIKNVLNFLLTPDFVPLKHVFGEWDIAFELLLTVIFLDFSMVICKAIYRKKLDSSIGAKGIVKKVGYLVVVAMAKGLDQINGNIGAIRILIIYFFIANESLSILENWGNMGLPLPKKIFNMFKQLKSESDEKIKERETKI